MTLYKNLIRFEYDTNMNSHSSDSFTNYSNNNNIRENESFALSVYRYNQIDYIRLLIKLVCLAETDVNNIQLPNCTVETGRCRSRREQVRKGGAGWVE